MTVVRTFARLALLALFAPLMACSYGPTPPSNVPPTGPQVVRGTVYPSGTTTVWLQSAHEGMFNVVMSEEKPAGVPVSIAFGGPTGPQGKCETDNPVTIAGVGAPQQVEAAAAGPFCIDVSDVGFVTQKNGVDFALTVTLH